MDVLTNWAVSTGGQRSASLRVHQKMPGELEWHVEFYDHSAPRFCVTSGSGDSPESAIALASGKPVPR